MQHFGSAVDFKVQYEYRSEFSGGKFGTRKLVSYRKHATGSKVIGQDHDWRNLPHIHCQVCVLLVYKSLLTRKKLNMCHVDLWSVCVTALQHPSSICLSLFVLEALNFDDSAIFHGEQRRSTDLSDN